MALKLLGYVFAYLGGCLSILLILELIRRYLVTQEQPKPEPVLDIENKSHTQQDILNEYKQNPGHKSLNRSEQRFRERLLKRHLKRVWSEQSRAQRREPVVNVDPSPKEASRMNRQLSRPSQPYEPYKPCVDQFPIAYLHSLFNRLCIYTVLPFLTFSIFCHSLRISLTESYLLQFEEEKEKGKEKEEEEE